MNAHEGLRLARGHIVWILALVVSTAVIVQLERVQFAVPPAADRTAVPVSTKEAIVEALDATRIVLSERPENPAAAAALVIALETSAQLGALTAAEIEDDLAALLPVARRDAALGPVVQDLLDARSAARQ